MPEIQPGAHGNSEVDRYGGKALTDDTEEIEGPRFGTGGGNEFLLGLVGTPAHGLGVDLAAQGMTHYRQRKATSPPVKQSTSSIVPVVTAYPEKEAGLPEESWNVNQPMWLNSAKNRMQATAISTG